ncbi:MAG: carotenoid oxygenase family protein, partial [Halobacteriota archaeon]
SEEASFEVVADEVFELPRFDYARRAGVEYEYAYGVGRRGDGFLDALLKVDVESGEAVYWSESGCYPGEPVFVERPGSSAEDDGVVLSVVLDSRERRSFLLVLDAESMDEVGRALAPHVVPHGFHGEYFE